MPNVYVSCSMTVCIKLARYWRDRERETLYSFLLFTHFFILIVSSTFFKQNLTVISKIKHAVKSLYLSHKLSSCESVLSQKVYIYVHALIWTFWHNFFKVNFLSYCAHYMPDTNWREGDCNLTSTCFSLNFSYRLNMSFRIKGMVTSLCEI